MKIHSRFSRASLWLMAGVFLFGAWPGTAWAQRPLPPRKKVVDGTETLGVMGRMAGPSDRALARMKINRLDVITNNFGDMGSYAAGAGFEPALYPNPVSGTDSHYYSSTMDLAIGPGLWFATPQVHCSDGRFNPQSKMDWEAMDGAAGTQYATPPQTYGGAPMMAHSDLEATWPVIGGTATWPAPETDTDVWWGTTTWYKWERKADREAYCWFDDTGADRNSESKTLGIDVKKRMIAFSSYDAVFFQFEFTNNSGYTLTDCFVGQHGDLGGPVWDSSVGIPYYDSARQMMYVVGQNFNATAGTHDGSGGQQVSWLGFKYLETPTGSFKADDTGTLVDTPDQILQRLSLLDFTDRIISHDDALYGAVTGDLTYLTAGEAAAIWMTDSSKQNPVYLQDETDFASRYDPTDPYWYASSGPFTWADGETIDFVVAYCAGPTRIAMFAAADKAVQSYQAGFLASGPPPAPPLSVPGVSAGPAGADFDSNIHAYPIIFTNSGSVQLSWDGSGSEPALDAVSGVQDFEGYRVYKSMNRGSSWGETVTDNQGVMIGYIPVAQFDLENTILGNHPVDGSYIGDDSGLKHSWTDTDVLDGYEYWYAVTSYDYAPPEPSFESPFGGDPNAANIISVIAGAKPAGYAEGMLGTGATAGATMSLETPADTEYESSISVRVIDQALITGDAYTVTVTSTGTMYGTLYDYLGGIQVRNTTDAADLLAIDTLPNGYYGDDLIPVTEGFQVVVAQPNDGVGGVYSLTQTTDIDTITGYTLYFSQSYMEGSGPQANRANRTGFMNKVEYRFTGYVTAGGDTNWGVATSTRGPLMVPYEVWDVDTNTRLYPLFYEFYGADRWYADDYHVVLPVPYFESDGVTVTDITAVHPSSDIEYWGYVTTNPNSRADWAYRWAFNEWDAPAFEDDPALNPYWDIGDVWTLVPFKVLKGYQGTSYPFTTTAPAIVDTLIDYDDIRVVPNPYYIRAVWDKSVNARKIQFTNVPANSTIEIYTLSGELVANLDHGGYLDPATGTRNYQSTKIGTVDWNLWTYEFTEAAYGLYIYVLKVGGDVKKVGKFAIIR